RPLALAGDLLAFEVDDAQVVGLHEALRDASRRAEDAILAQPETDVAVVGRCESLVVDPPADLAHLLSQLPLVHDAAVRAHGSSSPSSGFFQGFVSYDSCSSQNESWSIRHAQ